MNIELSRVTGSTLVERVVEMLATVIFVFVLAVLTNVVQQTLIGKKNRPPVVFHWIPVIGSTVTYGIDPFRFFAKCQAKVSMGNRLPRLC